MFTISDPQTVTIHLGDEDAKASRASSFTSRTDGRVVYWGDISVNGRWLDVQYTDPAQLQALIAALQDVLRRNHPAPLPQAEGAAQCEAAEAERVGAEVGA